MEKKFDRKFDLRDITIIPTIESNISSRSQCSIITEFNDEEMLPLMASPMDTVVCKENYKTFIEHGIIPCLPRSLSQKSYPDDSKYFQAFGLNEIEFQLEHYEQNTFLELSFSNSGNAFWHYSNVLIDIANAHMSKLIPLIKKIKKIFPTMNLMVGNVANPLTYKNLSMAGADYVRVSIGSGAGCTTAANVAINYPLGSLISECHQLKTQCGLEAKIVADGGMQGYDDIIKSLALGCFLPTTLVYTKNGFKQIQNVNINDYVYTHTGEYKKVINKFKYKNYKDIVSINGIYSTNNHHYYVINKKYKNLVTEKNISEYAEWVAAENLNSEYLLIEKNMNLLHRMQMYLKNIFTRIYISYLKLFEKIHEKIS